MSVDLSMSKALELWREALVDSVRREGPDLSARQMAILLTIYTTEAPHTVRGLAHRLNVSKPAITRALDTMGRLDLVRRRRDSADKRNVLIERTTKGSLFLSEFADRIRDVARAL